MSSPASPVISVRGLTFRYPESAVSFTFGDLSVGEGERLAVTGRSGCGKTTLLRLLTGLLKPTSGRVDVLDQPVHALSETERRRFRVTTIGSIPQELDLLDYLPIDENILLPYLINRTASSQWRQARHECERLASRLGLREKLSRHPHQLSQGERQRVAIARALITKPPILVADEPTGNLDGETARQVLDLVADLLAERTTTFLMVTHDLSLLDFFERRLTLNEPGGAPRQGPAA